MAGTNTGGINAAKKNKELYGEDFYKRIGQMGGKAKVPKGFALMTPEKRKAAGAKGGTRSKRGKALPKPQEPETVLNAMEYREDIDTDNQNHAGGVRKIWERAFKR